MVPLEFLQSLRSLRIFTVDTMCVNKRDVTVLSVSEFLQLY